MVTVLYTCPSRKSVNVLFSASYMLISADELETLEELISEDDDSAEFRLEELSSDEDVFSIGPGFSELLLEF